MSREISVIGLNHAHQLYGYKGGASDAFLKYLATVIPKINPTLLAEEMNDESLSSWGADKSTLQVASAKFHVPHLFCDPNTAERKTLKIESYQEIRSKLGYTQFLSDSEDLNVRRTERENAWPLREREWLRRIEEADSSHTLFLIGSLHIESFAELAQSMNYFVRIFAEQWEPRI